jgi:hypothetical protein
MNTVQDLGRFCLFYSFMKTNYISCSSSLRLPSTLFCSTDCYIYLIISQYIYNATTNYLRIGSVSSRRLVCNLSYQTLIVYLLFPIIITNNYFQIKVKTQYLQPLTVLHYFTNKTYLKIILSKISQQLDLILS